MKNAVHVLLLIGLAGCASEAPPSGAAAGPAAAQSSAAANTDSSTDESRVICKNLAQTGSRIGSQRVCMTANQWERQNQDGKDVVREGAKLKNPSG